MSCLLLPPGKPAEIWAVWRLPETGTTYLHADNDGTGFSVEKGEVTPINLVYEFARTEYRINVSAVPAALGRRIQLHGRYHPNVDFRPAGIENGV